MRAETHLMNLLLTKLMARRLQSPEQEPTLGTDPENLMDFTFTIFFIFYDLVVYRKLI